MKKIIFLLPLAADLSAQNLEKIGKEDMLTLSGGMNYSAVYTETSGLPAYRDPFNWYFNGNVTASVLDVSLPFTYSYTNRRSNYTQPFNIQAFTPSWKWIKGYAGFTSMNFSPYTLLGHLFLGGGLELSPKSWKLAGMYGRLKKAAPADPLSGSDEGLAYRRMGWGAMAAYEKNGQGFSLICFSAKDDAGSLLFIPPSSRVTPAENAVLSISGKTVLRKQLRLSAEYALSGLTLNTRANDSVGFPPKNKLPFLFRAKTNSQFFDALKSNLAWQKKRWSLTLGYERIAPGYQTLGAYFFNNDLENITLAPTANLFKGKLNLALNAGLQRNDLDGAKLNSTRRWVAAGNLNFSPSPKLNFTAGYSNFSTFTRTVPHSDPFYQQALDTLQFYQLAQQGNCGMSFRFGNKMRAQSLQLNAAYQRSGQFSGAISDPGLFGNVGNIIPTEVLNANLSYSLSFTKSKTVLSLLGNCNRGAFPQQLHTLHYGPGLNLAQAFRRNTIRLSLGSTYNAMLSGQEQKINSRSDILSHRAGLSWNPKASNEKLGRISLSAGTVFLQKFSANGPRYSFTGNFGAGYSF